MSNFQDLKISDVIKTGRDGKKRIYKLIRVHLGKDPISGKQIQVDITGKTEVEAVDKYIQNFGQYGEHSKLESNYTISSWYEIYKEYYLINIVTSATIKRYDSAIKKIVQIIGNKRLKDIRPSHVQYLVNRLIIRNEEVSARLPYIVLSKLTSKAVSNGYIVSDPCVAVKLPKVAKKNITILTPYQARLFLQICPEYKYGEILATILLSALRIREAIGLKFYQFDLNRQLLFVGQQIAPNNKDVVLDVKNHFKTSIYIPELLVEIVKKIKERRNITPEKEDEFVFIDDNGNPVKQKNIRLELQIIGKRLGISDLKVHSLRHTCATLVEFLTHDFYAAQCILRDKSQKTVVHYLHISEERKKESARIINDFYKEALDKLESQNTTQSNLSYK